MYEPPLNIYQTLSHNVGDWIDNQITAEVTTQLDVEVNKDELLKALKYDREQYDKGYKDGYSDGYAKGLIDGNPFNAISERISESCEALARTFRDNPDLLKSAIEKTLENTNEDYRRDD